MVDLKHIKYEVIKPALLATGLYSVSALCLVTGTGLKESRYLVRRQFGNGPARGWFQMEKPTYDDVWARGVVPYPALEKSIRDLVAPSTPSFDLLEKSDAFAAIMCRIKYRLIPENLPSATDSKGMAAYWKKYYNTYLGKGIVDSYTISLFQKSCSI